MFNTENLTDEEKTLWEKMSQQLENSFEEFKKENIEKLDERASNPETFQDPNEYKHVTTYPREIIIKLNAELSTVDKQTNMLLENDNIVDNFYHIPVPSGSNYIEKINDFLDKFDKEIENVAVKINTDESKSQE